MIIFFVFFLCQQQQQQQPSTNHAVYSKPPKCPQQQHSLSHLRGLVDVSPNVVTTKAEICATPPQNRRRFFIPKHLKSPFALYKNRNGNSGGSSDQNYTFSGKYFIFIGAPHNCLVPYITFVFEIFIKHTYLFIFISYSLSTSFSTHNTQFFVVPKKFILFCYTKFI